MLLKRSLAINGIVNSKQGDGTYLAASLHNVLSLPDRILTLQGVGLVELAEARSAIEPMLASLAALPVSHGGLDQIHGGRPFDAAQLQ